MLTYRLEYRDNIRVVFPRLDRAAVYKNRGAIQAGHAHDAAGHILVAAANGHHTIKAFAADDSLDRVGNNFARYERILHSLIVVSDPVRNGDGVENNALATRCVDAVTRLACKHVDM